MALRCLWPSSVRVEESGWLGTIAHNHMNTRITLNLWSCGLILFVFGTRRQTITQDICAEVCYHPSFAGKENCQKLLAEDAEQFCDCLKEHNDTSHCLGKVKRFFYSLGMQRNYPLYFSTPHFPCAARRCGKRFANIGICAVLRDPGGNSIRFPRGGRVRLAGTSPAKCY